MQSLEAESSHILREFAAELDNPVLLYSIGEDSSVNLHLALRAFHPSKTAFPLLHIDSTWEFREIIEFREQYARNSDSM
ncbi:MAG: phosphoadenosine phosphosulfate reductase family protein [Planctomycetales bacterium]|nr:phosphoadenosine phosphosulfate reductase family protein [Planctomycetales bacterium]MCA9171668.1 phosphoadenosine phosphosulfate reductase family protein [Planctomycetales bacterium]